MTKRTSLLAKATLKILCLSAVLLFWLHGGSPAQAQILDSATIDQIDGLDSIDFEFGHTQDSVVLTLKGGSETTTLRFGPPGQVASSDDDRDAKEAEWLLDGDLNNYLGYELQDGEKERLESIMALGNGGGESLGSSDAIVYVRYELKSGDADEPLKYSSSNDKLAQAKYCDESDVSPQVIVIAKVRGGGGDKDTSTFNFTNRRIWVNIILRLESTDNNSSLTKCFLLSHGLVSDDKKHADTPRFFLDSPDTDAGSVGSCEGLEIYGPGEDYLHKPGVIWKCIGDVDPVLFNGKEGTGSEDYYPLDHYDTVDNPPPNFGEYFVFVENRTWGEHCPGRILLQKAGFNRGDTTIRAEWQDWRDNCDDGPFNRDDRVKFAQLEVLNLNALSETEQDEALESLAFIYGGDGSDGLIGGSSGGCSGHGAGGLSWAFCGILLGVSNGIEAIERQIYSELRIDRVDYQGKNCDTALASGACNYRKVWSNMRNLMTLAVVGTAILMVIATALDVGWFSNYTVKKYLARLIAGVVLMTMSWAIGDFIISLAGQLGGFVGSAITAPFAGGDVPAANIGLESIFSKSPVGSGVAAGTGIVAGGVIWLAAGISVVPILLTAFLGLLAILAGFMFLIFRQAVIIALLVFAPVGVALWFLPGSDKMWRLYYRTFLSLVFIYPIIVGVIAFGRVFIWVLLQSEEGPERSPLLVTVAFLVYVGMFMAIPILFKKFLGAINQITGGSNNPAKGIFDRVKNARSGYMNRRKEQHQRKTDREDDKKLDEIRAAEEHSKPVSALDKVNRARIRAKRSWRYGLPFVPAPSINRGVGG